MRRSRRRPWTRVLAVAVSIAVACWLAYVVIANVLLFSGYIESRVSEPERRILEIERAWTLWPGRVHVRGLRVGHAENDLQFEIGLARATVDIDLAALMRRELVVHSLDAEALTLRVRRLLKEPEKHRLRVRGLPKIAGFSDDPRAKPEPPDPRSPEERKLWTFDIRGIDATLREVWFDELDYRGRGRVRGAFRLEPEQSLQVQDSEVSLGGGDLAFGELRPIASEVSGTISGHVRRLDVRKDAKLGWRAARNFTLHGTLGAAVADLKFVEAYSRSAGVSVGGGAGKLELVLGLERGELTPESRVEFRSRRLELGIRAVSLEGDVRLRLDTIRSGRARRGRLQLAGDRIALFARGSGAFGTLRDLELELLGSNVDLAREWRASGGELAIGSLHIPDLKRLNRLKHGESWQLDGGSVIASALATLEPDGSLGGSVALRLQSAGARIGEVGVRATGLASARVTQPSVRSRTGQIRDARLKLSRFAFSTPTGSSGVGTLRASSRRIELRSLRPRKFHVEFASSFGTADGVLDALDVARSGLGRLARHFVDLEDLRIAGRASYESGKLRVAIDRAATDGVSASGVVERGQRDRSRFEVDLGLFELSKSSGR